MKKYLQQLRENPLFQDISEDDITTMCHCLSATTRTYQKKEYIFLSGDEINELALVISGSVKIIQEDFFANESILAIVPQGEIFAEVFTCAEISHSPVTVQAQEKTEILFFQYQKLLHTCDKNCNHHRKLTENLLKVLAKKCLFLNKKLEILSKRSTREKILAFLQQSSQGKKKFQIQLNREEMANFISVDRSAMSAELSKMKKENIILYHKNQFEIL